MKKVRLAVRRNVAGFSGLASSFFLASLRVELALKILVIERGHLRRPTSLGTLS